MAEDSLFSIAAELSSTITSRRQQAENEGGPFVTEAWDELTRLKAPLEAIQYMLPDAEKKQQVSAGVRLWIKRVSDVLYQVEDLFDEPTFGVSKEVSVLGPLLSRIVSRDSVKKVKDINKTLGQISKDMAPLQLKPYSGESPIYGVSIERDEEDFEDLPREVIGRNGDKKAILEFLFDGLYVEHQISVIAIVGIGGMGTTALAQQVYNDEMVEKKFERRWWACISNVVDERDVIGKVYQSITGKSYQDLGERRLMSRIEESLKGDAEFLLVLDDLWDVEDDEDRRRWIKLMDWLGSWGAKGSKIIVTTRYFSVAKAVGAHKTHKLQGLSPEKAWQLFKRLAFTEEQASSLRWTSQGEAIVKKCAGVPLAIRSIASLLRTKTAIEEWVSFKNSELSRMGSSDNLVISALKLSYDRLSEELKQCFAYCCLFPKDHRIHVRELIYLWIAQGYVKKNNEEETIEEAGHAYFRKLLEGSFFQVVEEDGVTGEILYCKMHSLLHDLAQLVAGDESIILSVEDYQFSNPVRHLSVGVSVDRLEKVLPPIVDNKPLQSLLFLGGGSISPLNFDRRRSGLKSLRALNLSSLHLEDVPGCIADLVNLQYLNLSHNNFRSLPDSLTRIESLSALDISGCQKLESLPEDFSQLINLRHLDNKMCYNLTHMPRGFVEMTSLQSLSYFKVSNASEFIKLDITGLAKLKLRGELEIAFSAETKERLDVDDTVDCELLSISPQLKVLKLSFYPMSVFFSFPSNLVSLELSTCRWVKYLPHLGCYHSLRRLILQHMDELHYVLAGSSYSSFPSLLELELRGLPKLEGWSKRGVQPMSSLPCLLRLVIGDCPKLKSFPPAPVLESLKILGRQPTEKEDCGGLMAFPGLCLTSLLHLHITKCNELKKLHLAPPSSSGLGEKEKNGVDQGFPFTLSHVELRELPELESFWGEALASLQQLQIANCMKLKSMHLPPANLNFIRRLYIQGCTELEQFEGEALTSLSQLRIECCNKLKDLYLPQQPNALEELWVQDCAELETFQGETLTSLQRLHIVDCTKLKNVQLPPPSVNLIKKLDIRECPELERVYVGALKFLQQLRIEYCSKLKKLYFPLHPNALKELWIWDCPELETFIGQSLTSLQRLEFCDCSNLTKVLLPPKDQNVVEHLTIRRCRRLELWEEGERGLDWNSLSILSLLTLSEDSEPEKFPKCLQERKDRSELCINNYPLLTSCHIYNE